MEQMTCDLLYIDGMVQKRCDGLCGTMSMSNLELIDLS